MSDKPESPRRILFLCTGNYYRSRFAEIFFNTKAAATGLLWRADSRALAIERGAPYNAGPISEFARAGLAQRGIIVEADPRYPAQAADEDFTQSDLIIAVKEAEHRPLMEERYPNFTTRVEYWHVHDLDAATPEDALRELERHLHDLLTRLTLNPSIVP